MADRDKTATIELKVRMKEPLRARIEAAAKDRGVSMNAEAVERLEQSFRDRGSMSRTLEFAYGPQAAGLILSIMRAMTDAGLWAMVSNPDASDDFNSWPQDPAAYGDAMRAVAAVLETLRPGAPVTAEQLKERVAQTGSRAAERTIRLIVDGTTEWAIHRRQQLGDLVKAAPAPAARKRKGSTQ